MIYGVSLLHSVICDRSKFGPIGFTDKYVFDNSDLNNVFFMLNNILNLFEDYPWDAINYLISDIVYGGRITDD